MDVLFLLQIICLVVATVTTLMKKQFKHKELLNLISVALTVVLGLGVFFVGSAFKSVALGVSICTILSFVLATFSKGKTQHKGLKSTARFASKALLVIMLLESLVFNFNSFHVWSGDYKEFSLSIEDAQVQNLTANPDGTYSLAEQGKAATIEFLDINKEIGTIFLDVESNLSKVSYTMDFADESNSSYYIRQGLVDGEIFPEIEDSKYVITNFSGEAKKLRMSLNAEDGNFTIKNTITFNLDHPSTFLVLRVLTFLLTAVFVFLFTKSVFLNRSIKEQSNSLKSVTAFVVAVLLCLMVFCSCSVHYYRQTPDWKPF